MSYFFADEEQTPAAELMTQVLNRDEPEPIDQEPLPDDVKTFIYLPEAPEVMATFPNLSPSQRLSIITVIRAMLERGYPP